MWQKIDNTFQKFFVFNTFKEALSFVQRVGEIAEELQHHPTITLQNYNEVFISTTTHDAGNTITEKDRELIKKIDDIPLNSFG